MRIATSRKAPGPDTELVAPPINPGTISHRPNHPHRAPAGRIRPVSSPPHRRDRHPGQPHRRRDSLEHPASSPPGSGGPLTKYPAPCTRAATEPPGPSTNVSASAGGAGPPPPPSSRTRSGIPLRRASRLRVSPSPALDAASRKFRNSVATRSNSTHNGCGWHVLARPEAERRL